MTLGPFPPYYVRERNSATCPVDGCGKPATHEVLNKGNALMGVYCSLHARSRCNDLCRTNARHMLG